MADETTGVPSLKVIEGGLPKPPTPEFPEDTRTGIQKRIKPALTGIKEVVKGVIAAEFGADGKLKLGNTEHERRFSRALYVEVGRVLFDLGIRLHSIENGSKALADGCLRNDLLAEGVNKQNIAPSAPWVENGADGVQASDEEDEGEDGEEEIDS